MSRRNASLPKLDLKLNLSPPRVNPRVESPGRSATASPTSPPSSCVSSEMSQDDTLRYSSSPEATSMVLVGCPRCLIVGTIWAQSDVSVLYIQKQRAASTVRFVKVLFRRWKWA
ncbi:hypothetical protein SADUNF_Sadunf16G0066400 [Salix dunnii]|uniref:Uncharacterized protein n=1 Tax=Salix dunnii TaxID=1413687 RepID=A0A835JAR5_9ROSI|nr:hypothetical protein SADUNF_Sadunf16G0066400 [Salix dunnii]